MNTKVRNVSLTVREEKAAAMGILVKAGRKDDVGKMSSWHFPKLTSQQLSVAEAKVARAL